MAAAMERTGPLEWLDEIAGPQVARPDLSGDVVLVRKDVPASYHLAVTLDDATDAISHVTRGMDLFSASPIHRLLQALLGLPVPVWHHHPLLIGPDGRKLAKRRGSPSLADRRRAGEDGRALALSLRELALSLRELALSLREPTLSLRAATREFRLPAGISLSDALDGDP